MNLTAAIADIRRQLELIAYREDSFRSDEAKAGGKKRLKPPLCTVGTSCGFSCISKNVTCRKKLRDMFDGDGKAALNALKRIVLKDMVKTRGLGKGGGGGGGLPSTGIGSQRSLPDPETRKKMKTIGAKKPAEFRLTGTPKQVAWAEKIARPAIERYPSLRAYSDASFWIDNRNVPYHALYLYDRRKRGEKFVRWHTWTSAETTRDKDGNPIRVRRYEVTDRYAVFGSIPKEQIDKMHLGFSKDLATVTLSSDRDKLREQGLTTISASSIAPEVKRKPAAWIARIRQGSGKTDLFPIYDNSSVPLSGRSREK